VTPLVNSTEVQKFLLGTKCYVVPVYCTDVPSIRKDNWYWYLVPGTSIHLVPGIVLEGSTWYHQLLDDRTVYILTSVNQIFSFNNPVIDIDSVLKDISYTCTGR
jgi:hypothetical protein